MKPSDNRDGSRKLRIDRETIRVLDGDQLARVQGGWGGIIVIAAVPKVSRCCTTEAP